jgi:hypothetical protein
MTDELTPDEEAISEAAKAVADVPPETEPAAEHLPDEVPDGDAGADDEPG